jgi:hypothetical protein
MRLAEKGFLPFEEAIEIYQYLKPESLRKKPPSDRVLEQRSDQHPAPVSISLLIQGQDLFHASLQQIDDLSLMEKLQREFAAMCNQIISADSLAVRDKEVLTGVVRKACGYLSIGLDRITGGNVSQAAGLLQSIPLTLVFRVGYGSALELKWKAEKWIKQSWFGKQSLDLGFWGEDWGGTLEGLLKKKPLFHTGMPGSEPYREFRTLEEIAAYQHVLDGVIATDDLLSLLFPKSPTAFPVDAYQPVTFKNLVLTCWARHHLKISGDVEPLTMEQLKILFESLWKKPAKHHRIDPGMKQAFIDWLQLRSGMRAEELKNTPTSTLDFLFVELEQEYGAVSQEDLDPRYIKHFLVRN